MININTITGENLKRIAFPDGQPHINISTENWLCKEENFRVVAPIRNPKELLELLEISNAIDNTFGKKKELIIPYLMGARSDRVMQPGDSVDLKVVADMINYCNFDKVNLFDVHSEVATLLIKNSKNHNNSRLVEKYDKPNSVLICPDTGAAKKIDKYLEWNKNLTEVVYCIKSRDLDNGRITLKVLESEKCKGRNCVIIDDLCDGGGTFIAIAQQIAPESLTLIVSHGIFSKGIRDLERKFNEIIVSDSYQKIEHPIVKLVLLNL